MTDKTQEKISGPGGSSAHPEGWPNMPARSADHEPKKQGQAEVTEQQRELEKNSPTKQS